ncbi:peptidyl-prolyl cis-trans isomerase FKBP8 [Pogona vitticeps]|uniref:peptidylprolyl isomerase n=1 Tax=Pogona vitticeps TaxID=103695 RepID=A0ABM5EWW1_9SAUR
MTGARLAATLAFLEMLQGTEKREEPRGALQPEGREGESGQEEGGGSPSSRHRRRVQFLLPHTVIEVPPPQEEERAFYQRLERLLGPAGTGGFQELFAADGWEDLAEGKCLRKRLVRGAPGESRRPQPGQEVTVKLLGALEDLSLVERDPSRTFVLGQGEVVQALDLGVLSMQLGEVALFLACPASAYGHQGREPDVPKEAALLYEVTLLQVRDSPDPGLLPAAERLHRGHQKRALGNFHFEREEYRWALRSYQQALEVLPSPGPGGRLSPEEEEEGRELRIKCLNNCAAAQLKLQRLEEALASCNEVTRLDPDNVKALYRKGKLLSERGEAEAAMAVLKRALQLEPTTKAIHLELSKLARRQREQPGSPGPGGIPQEDSAAPTAADGHQTRGSAPQRS